MFSKHKGRGRFEKKSINIEVTELVTKSHVYFSIIPYLGII